MTESRYAIAIVGGGPSAVYSMERLAALATAGRMSKPVVIHVFDKGGNFGDGEVHSARQPQVSFLNRIAGQVSFAADETIEGAEPLLPPEFRLNLAEWCEERYRETRDERYAVGAADWPKRYVHGEALRYHFEAYVRLLGEAGVEVVLHALEVVDIDASGARIQLVCGDGSTVREIDQVLLVTGHSWNDPERDPRRRDKAEHARQSGVSYIGSAYPLDRGLTAEAVPAGSVVACEGMGLTAIDIVLYLTEGRGGGFVPDGSRLRYLPSGAEPSRIIPFSGSGLFTFARPENHKQVDLALHEHRGVFLTEEYVDTIRENRGEPAPDGAQLDFERDIFPLVLLEMTLVHVTTLFGGDTGAHLQKFSEGRVAAFLAATPAQAPMAAEAALAGLRDATAQVAELIDQRLDGVRSLDECRAEANGWDFGLAAASFMHCVWGDTVHTPAGTVLSAAYPRRYLPSESPTGLSDRASENTFDWDRTIRPIPGSACDDPERYRAAILDFFERDDTAAAHGNLANPAKAAADGVWRDLRDVLAHAVDRGGLTPSSHRRFLEVYMRHHNRLANGAAREVMAKIRAVAECGILDVGVGPGGSVRLDSEGYHISGALTGYEGHADILVDATVHAFDPRLDLAPLYRNLLDRGVVRLWENRGGKEGSEVFVPGGLDLDESFSPRLPSGEVDQRITVLGPPSEGVVFFQLGALRPEQNHHVMRDILTWVDKLGAEGLLGGPKVSVSGESLPRACAVMVESPVTGAGADAARLLDTLGFQVLLLAHDPEAMPSYLREQLNEYDVRIVQTDTQSMPAMLASIRNEVAGEPAAVLTFYEYYAAQAAQLAAEMGLPGPDPQAVMVCRDKAAQRDALSHTDLSLRYARCGTPEEAAEAAEAIGGDVIVKPTNLTGSVLVRRCGTAAEAADAAAAVLSQGSYLGVPVNPQVVVEEFIEGAEFSVELMHGKAVAVTGKELGEGTVIEVAHTVPPMIPQEVRSALVATAEAACEAIGLRWGPAHVEVRREPSGRVTVIEINARVAGDRIPELVRLVTGRDLVQEQVCAALGRDADSLPGETPVAVIRFRQGPGGRLDHVAGETNARSVPGVREVHVRIAEGQEHRLNGSNQDRVAWCIATGEDAAEALARAGEALALLDLSWISLEGEAQ